jgi:hypothetical protein
MNGRENISISCSFPGGGRVGTATGGEGVKGRSSRRIVARKNRDCVSLPVEFGIFSPEFIVPA